MKLEQFFKKMIFTIRFNQFLPVIIQKKLYCTLAILHKFTLHVIFLQKTLNFKIWMDNWRMVLANMEQVVRKEKWRANRMI